MKIILKILKTLFFVINFFVILRASYFYFNKVEVSLMQLLGAGVAVLLLLILVIDIIIDTWFKNKIKNYEKIT